MRWLTAVLLYPALFAADPAPITIDPQPPAEAPFIGVSLDEVDDALNHHLNLANDLGILVVEVMPDSPADKMGLKTWDVIVAADAQQVYTPRAFQGLIAGKKVGDPIGITIRRGAEEITCNGTVAARPPEAQRPFRPRGFSSPGTMPGMPDIEELQRQMQEQMRNLSRQPPGSQPLPSPNGQRSGKIKQPDGSVLEWSVEEDKSANSL